MDCSPLGSSAHGVLQPIMLGWVSISFSKESSQPRDQGLRPPTGLWQAGSLPLASPSMAIFYYIFKKKNIFENSVP